MLGLPKTATAPFCPSEVKGTVFVSPAIPVWQRALRFAGPGLLISVGYMDPGNWATDIQAGSQYGYALLFVVVLSSLAAIVLQCLSARLGLVTGRDLAVLTQENYGPAPSFVMWALAELAIVATDLAEVLGSALAFKLLLGVALPWGVLSLQLPFAMWPLIRFSGRRDLMGEFANSLLTRLTSWTLFAVISAANVWLVLQVIGLV